MASGITYSFAGSARSFRTLKSAKKSAKVQANKTRNLVSIFRYLNGIRQSEAFTVSPIKLANPTKGVWIKVKKIRFLPGNKLQVVK